MGVRHTTFLGLVSLSFCTFASSSLLNAAEAITSGPVRVLATMGDAQISTNGITWQPLDAGVSLPQGTSVRTGIKGSVDFLVVDTGGAFRLKPNSEVLLERSSRTLAGEDVVSTTTLSLQAGTAIGSQPKLSSPSTFQIETADSRITISATEYVVRADGAVSAINGSVRVNYVEPGAGGAVRITLDAGESFDPETRTVVMTTPEYLEDLIDDVETMSRNAHVYRVDGARIVVQPEPVMSPHQPVDAGAP